VRLIPNQCRLGEPQRVNRQVTVKFHLSNLQTICHNFVVSREANMRPAALILLTASFIPCMVSAQEQAPPVRQVQAQDGGAREVLESIVIPPMRDAPFTLSLHTEWVRSLSDSGAITLENQRRIARDGNGRIYEERWFLVPKNGKAKSRMNVIQIADPELHTLYDCFFDGRQICALLNYSGTTSTVYKIDGPPAGPLPNNTGVVTRENLGNELIAGVDTVGTRETTVYNPGVFGNDQKLTLSREYWFASQLGIDLVSRRSDPRFGTQNFTVTSVDLGEPDPKLFDLPEGFKVEDRRPPATNRPN
jgi:hypothetical protein